ncbi:MAG: hypothetical protein AB8E82_04070 [Aureispira sp.]
MHQISSTNTVAADSLVLTKMHLNVIQNFEKNLWEKVHFDEETLDHFSPNYSFVTLPRKRSMFRASGQIGHELWQELLAVNKEGLKKWE